MDVAIEIRHLGSNPSSVFEAPVSLSKSLCFRPLESHLYVRRWTQSSLFSTAALQTGGLRHELCPFPTGGKRSEKAKG